MRRFLFDTTIFLYALGREHPLRAPCREILRLSAARRLAGEASVELVHEFAHVLLRRPGADRSAVLRQARDIPRICTRVHDSGWPELEAALELLAHHPRLDVRDALFAATAARHGIDAILTADGDFDAVAELERIDPGDPECLARLGLSA